jgi:hypothetical protein
MATKNTALRNKQGDDFRALWANATLVIRNEDSDHTVVSFALGATPFAAASNGVITLQGTPIAGTAANAYSGGVIRARLISSGSTYLIDELTVGTSAAQVIISSLTILQGQTINLNSLTFTVPATVN